MNTSQAKSHVFHQLLFEGPPHSSTKISSDTVWLQTLLLENIFLFEDGRTTTGFKTRT